MNKFTKEMYEEGRRRMEYLIEMYGLYPNLSKYLKERNVYYSYITGGGLMGSIDTVTYDPRYEEIVKRFENEFGGFVYHCIEAGNTLDLLFVGKEAEEWERSFGKEKTSQGTLVRTISYVYNFDENCGEMGYIYLAGGRDIVGNMILIRVG